MKKIIRFQGKMLITYLSVFSILVASVMSAFIGLEITTTASNMGDVWDGTTDSEWDGTGTKNDPYQITTAAELRGMIYSQLNKAGTVTKKYFKLMNDIYINDVSTYGDTYNGAWRGTRDWLTTLPDSSDTDSWKYFIRYGFIGELDGNYKTVYGLYTENNNNDFGLIPCAYKGTVIKNLTIAKSYIAGAGNWKGAVVGRMYQGSLGSSANDTQNTVMNVGVEDTVTIINTNNAAGGLIGGVVANTTVENCYSQATILGGTVGGIVADAWAGTATVSKCYSVGYSPVPRAKIAFVLSDLYTTVADPGISGVVHVDDAAIKGDNALTNMPALSSDVWATTESYPIIVAPTPSTPGINEEAWDGTADIEWKGAGTKTDPYQIYTAEELYGMIHSQLNIDGTVTKKYFKLMNDIYINDVSTYGDTYNANWRGTKDWLLNYDNTDVVWQNMVRYGFIGELDGNFKTVYGLYTENNNNDFGLIPCAYKGTVIKNLTIAKSYIAGAGNFKGAIVGRMWEGTSGTKDYSTQNTIMNVGIKDTVTINNTGSVAGGVVGAIMANTTVTNCYSQATVTGGEYIGGIVGDSWAGTATVSKCYSVGCSPVPRAKATFVLSDLYTTVTPATEISGVTTVGNEDIKGDRAKTIMPKLDWDEIWATVDNDYPVLAVYEEYNQGTVGGVWSGKMALSFSDGDGTKNDPYIIETPEQLYKAIKENIEAVKSEEGVYYEITEDIYLNDVSNPEWYKGSKLNTWITALLNNAGPSFTGYIEGNGHYIYGLYADGAAVKAALLPIASGKTTVFNVHIRNSYLNTIRSEGAYVGGIVGYVQADATVQISGCSVRDTIFGNGENLGGIVGAIGVGTLNIDSCYFVGSFDGDDYKLAGGMYADCWGTASVSNSYSVGAVMIDKTSVLSPAVRYGTISQETSKKATHVSVTVVTEDSIKGENAKTTMADLDWEETWYVVDGDYPHLNKTYTTMGVVGGYWSGKKAPEYAGGIGTEDDPYQIATGEQLYKMVAEHCIKNDKPAYYVLTHDIKLNDVTSADWVAKTNLKSWHSVSVFTHAFAGHFDGQGHVVSGLYFDDEGEELRVSLIPCVTAGATIKNVGLTQSYIDVGMGNKVNYAAAIVAYIDDWDSNHEITEQNTPLISQCFADSTVVIRGVSAGGMICGLPSPARIENCYFNGRLDCSFRHGTMLGNTWVYGSTITNTYSAGQNMENIVGGMTDTTTSNYSGCYVYGGIGYGSGNGVSFLSYVNMLGDKAIEYMPEFDFENIWMTVEGGTPVLRIFGERAADFTDSLGRQSTIQFVTNVNDYALPSMTGKIMSPLKLPIPERYGYTFGGWYVYPELQCEFTDTIFPYMNLTLYAKWIKSAIIEDFETYPNTSYDLDDDYILYRPGVAGYNAENVHGGGKSMLRKATVVGEQDFLLNYEDELVPGTEYVMTFWAMSTADASNEVISLVHPTWCDVNEPDLAVEKMFTLTGCEKGVYKQYKYTFIAKSHWISIRTTGTAPIYFDDFILVPTGKVDMDIVDTDKTVNTEKPDAVDDIVDTGDNRISIKVLLAVFAVSAAILFTLNRKCRSYAGKHK